MTRTSSNTPDFDIDTLAAGAARARTMEALFGPDAGAPRRIAGYAVLDVLGRGAMGVVYLAHDERLDRSVALKLLDPGRRNDPKARASLVTEAKQIARVQHPNVVAVYEVGSHQGDTFLAMEYVAGPTLREWTLGAEHTVKQILRVFVDAGRGLAAVHDAGLLHRDFKPSNVLVTASGTAKVADFGLARRDDEPTTQDSGEHPSSRDAQATGGSSGFLVGTPAYMAPEQVLGATTARSDQFAFGIALLEALCGRHPLGRDPAYTLDAATGTARIDALDRARLPGWLFAILRRAVAWDPDARWPDMATLVAALEQDPNRRRWRILAGFGVATVLGLAGGGWYAWSRALAERCSGAGEQIADAWGGARREEMRAAFVATDVPYAEAARESTEAALDEYAREWVQSHTDACEATSVRGEQSTEVMDLRMACLQRAKTGLAAVTAVLADADADVAARAHEVVGGLRPLSRCADVTALRADVEPPRPEHVAAIERVRQHLAEAGAQTDAGRVEDAERSMQAAREVLATTDYGPAHAELKVAEGILHEQSGRYEESEASLREAVELASRWRQWDELEMALSQLVFIVGSRLQRPEDALRYRELAVGLAAGDPRRTASIDLHVGMAFLAQGKYEEAEQSNRRALAAYEEAYGLEHPHVASARNNLAAVLWQRGKQEEAQAEVRRALEIRVRTIGAEHPETVRSRNNLALMLMAREQYEEAEAESRVVLEYWQRMYGPSHPEVAAAHNNVGLVVHRRGRVEEAEAEMRKGLAIREKLLGAEHPSVAESRANLSDVLVDRRAYDEAIEQAQAAIDVWSETLGAVHPFVAAARHSMARALVGRGDLEAAVTEHRRALAVRERTLGEEHLDVAQSRSDLAALLLRMGGEAEAIALAERAWERAREDDALPKQRGDAAFVLARALWTDPASHERALDLAHRALDVHATADLRSWLAQHEP